MSKKILIAANWKMNLTLKEAIQLTQDIIKEYAKFQDRELILLPSFLYITELAKLIKGTNIGLGGQDICFEKSGAYTGEVAGFQLKEVGCTHVLIGHSERRHYFHEDYEAVNKKVLLALENDLKPILCVGESMEERDKGITEMVVIDQLESALQNIDPKHHTEITIAYEPIWAIGTGKTATPKDASHVHSIIHKTLNRIFNEKISKRIRILYGGSVKSDNVHALLQQDDIDGALVGGASLKLDSLLDILKNSVR